MRDFAARKQLRTPDAFVEFRADECDQSIHRRFEEQVSRRPTAPAVRLPSGAITYADLNGAANRAARRLLATAGGDKRPVAILMHQGLESIVWILAILKAGLCYAPLDQRIPESVLRKMIDHLAPGALVADTRNYSASVRVVGTCLPIVESLAASEDLSAENLDLPVSPESIAYVFYTSGSTAASKGVADCHRNVLHNVMRYTNSLKFAPGDTFSLVQNPSFSGTVSTLFGALSNGAAVAPYDLGGEGLPGISRWLNSVAVTVFHSVPSIFRHLSDSRSRFPHIRLVRLEGDQVTALDVKHFITNFRNDCILVNGLGATECGLVRQFFINRQTQWDSHVSVPVGYSVPDMAVYVMDDTETVVPPGSAGEIVVESKYLATEYWRDPQLTAERFAAIGGGRRRYRTRDLGTMTADGCLTHLGRIDQRIRIGGEFVDALEIESALLDVTGILQAVVRDYTDEIGERRLCAYIVAARGANLNVTKLREVLSKGLAAHLVPTVFVFVEALPLTRDLKIDYARLPSPGRHRPPLANDYVAPQTALERQLVRIWSEVLEIDRVGVTDSFFDLGGDSLQATRIASRLNEQLGVPVLLSGLFELRTIRALAQSLGEP